MGRVSGDKARYNRKRRKLIAKRVEMRALAKQLRASAASPATPAEKTRTHADVPAAEDTSPA